MKWEVLTEVQGRLEAEFLKSYLEAQGIEVELFQEVSWAYNGAHG